MNLKMNTSPSISAAASMETESPRWFAEQDLEDYNLIHEYHMNPLAELTVENFTKTLHIENLHHSISYPSVTGKLHQSLKLSSTPHILSFEAQPSNMSEDVHMNLDPIMKPKDEATSPSGNMHFQALISKPSRRGSNCKKFHSIPSPPPHHILAERKRRQKISQQLIALSAMIPILKKMDKASVLGDAIKYMKQLQERVKVLEEQTKKRSVESVVLVKKSQASADDNNFEDGGSTSALPAIEARVSEKDVLIRIHCDKQQGFVPKILNEIQNLHLSIINTSVLSFGNSTLDITVIAQMDAEFAMAVKDVVKNLRIAFLNFM